MCCGLPSVDGWPFEIGLKKSVVSGRAFVWPHPPTPNYHWDRSQKKCCIWPRIWSGLTPPHQITILVREIVAKQGNICFFEIDFWFYISHHRFVIITEKQYRCHNLSHGVLLCKDPPTPMAWRWRSLGVPPFQVTQIWVDEICAWLEAWKTDIWEGRGQWCARRHLSNDPCFLCLALGNDLPSQEKLPMSTSYHYPQKDRIISNINLFILFWSTCLSFFLAFL